MPSTYTSNLGLEKQADGENDSQWGSKANTVFQQIDEAISGVASITLTATGKTISISDGGTDEEPRHFQLDLDGTPTAVPTMIVPNIEKAWIVRNNTGKDVEVRTATGSTATIAAGADNFMYCDGSNVIARALPNPKFESIRADNFYGRNLIINGSMRVAQRGTLFTSATTPANSDDTYLLDRWILLSDGNDIVDVTQQTNGTVGNYAYLQADVETTQKKFGFAQIIEQKNIIPLLSEDKKVSLSFNARVSDASKLDNIKAVVLSWTSTADNVTSDVVSSWNAADTTPTWAANLTAENTPATLSVTATDTRFKIEGIDIDASGVNNLIVFIWSDAVADNDTAGTLLQITDVQLEVGSVATEFEHEEIGTTLRKCLRYYERFTPDANSSEGIAPAFCSSTTAAVAILKYTQKKRSTPTITYTAAGTYQLIHEATATTLTSVSSSIIGKETLNINCGVGSGLTAGNGAILRRDSGDTTYIEIDAEL